MAWKMPERKTNTTNRNNGTNREPSPYDGLWINFGPSSIQKDEEGNEVEVFHRLPRGVAVSDLQPHRIYATTKPDWAKEAALVNAVIEAIQAKGLTLEEGESVPLKLDVVLYRRQEALEGAPAQAEVDSDAVADQLFG